MRIYGTNCFDITNSKGENVLNQIYDDIYSVYDSLEEDKRDSFIITAFNQLREVFQLEDKVILLAKHKTTKETAIVQFDCKPNNKVYNAMFDENKGIYIEIEETEIK